MKRFTLDRVWAVLKKEPRSTSHSIAAQLGWTPRRVSNALYTLRLRGLARLEGRSQGSRWYAMGKKPTCHWGSHENSVANLLAVPEAERMARLGVVRSVKPPPRVASTCALDACWKLNIVRTGAD